MTAREAAREEITPKLQSGGDVKDADAARPQLQPGGEGRVQPTVKTGLRNRLTRTISLLLIAVGLVTLGVVASLAVLSAQRNLAHLEEQIRGALVQEGQVLIESHCQLFQSLVADYAILDVHNTVARSVHNDENLLYGLFISADDQLWAFGSPERQARVLEPGMELGTPTPSVAAAALGVSAAELHATAAATREVEVFGEPILEFVSPVFVAGEYSGTLRYGMSQRSMAAALASARDQSRDTLWQVMLVLAGVVLLTVVLGAAFAARLADRITKPITQLTLAARALSTGQRDVKVEPDTGDEIETLGHAFNTMVTDLDASYEAVSEQNRVIRREMEERQRAEHERTEIESRLIQAQKMEAFGQIAGGVAHDFNNILAVIMGQAELSLMSLQRDVDVDVLREDLSTVLQAGTQGANLTRQLLTFARRETNNPRVVGLAELVGGFERMMRRVIEEHIEIEIVCADDTPRVLIDPGRFEQVIMNLVVNARDAMPRGGRLRLSTRMEVVKARRQLTSGVLEPGRHAVLDVEDTGAGMAQETVDRIFEPFFTTKGVGVGTGLGLATVHGIVRDAEGCIGVDSQLGKGTRFSIWLRAVSGSARPKSEPGMRVLPAGRGQRVLVCEDEPGVRALTTRILREAGYDVVSTPAAPQAKALLEEDPPVQLLVTDVVMPGISGPELVQSLGPKHAGLPVLYVSGYTDDLLDEHGVGGDTRRLLRKPFRPVELLQAVDDMLAEAQRRDSEH